MKKTILAGVAALAFAGSVSAQQPAAPGDITRAAAVADAERRFAALDADSDGVLGEAEMRQMFEQRRAERLARMSPEDRARFEERRVERGGERRAEGGGERGTRRGGRGEGGGEGRGMRRGMRGGEAGGIGRGPVTVATFRAQAEQRFDRLDLDRDGVITRAEQEQLRAQRGAARSGD
ncbi:MAG TPA: hypothetical protein VGB79_04480 [Allosphingosinicella sp.]|jgi:hypothetical protein